MKKWKYRNPLKPFFPNLTKPRFVAIDNFMCINVVGESNSLAKLDEYIDNYQRWNDCSNIVIYDRHKEGSAKALKEMGID